MIFKFSYGKLTRPNQQVFSTAGITTYLETDDFDLQPLGAAGTTAPSTILVDRHSGFQYTLAKPFSAVNAVMSAITSTNDAVSLL